MKRAYAIQKQVEVVKKKNPKKKDKKEKRKRRKLVQLKDVVSKLQLATMNAPFMLPPPINNHQKEGSNDVQILLPTHYVERKGNTLPSKLVSDVFALISSFFKERYQKSYVSLLDIIRFYSIDKKSWQIWRNDDKVRTSLKETYDKLLKESLDFRFLRQLQLLTSYEMSICFLNHIQNLWFPLMELSFNEDGTRCRFSFYDGENFDYKTLDDLLCETYDETYSFYLCDNDDDYSNVKGIVSPLVLRALVNVDSYLHLTNNASLVFYDKDEEGYGRDLYVTQPYTNICLKSKAALLPYPFTTYELSFMYSS